MINSRARLSPRYNLDGLHFVARENSGSGEVSSKTVFEYRQKGTLVWATYAGGEIVYGQLLGQYISEDRFRIRYQHINTQDVLMTGKCETRVSQEECGSLRLDEAWEWTSGDLSSGISTLVEVE
jgi:subtilase family serine protease